MNTINLFYLSTAFVLCCTTTTTIQAFGNNPKLNSSNGSNTIDNSNNSNKNSSNTDTKGTTFLKQHHKRQISQQEELPIWETDQEQQQQKRKYKYNNNNNNMPHFDDRLQMQNKKQPQILESFDFANLRQLQQINEYDKNNKNKNKYDEQNDKNFIPNYNNHYHFYNTLRHEQENADNDNNDNNDRFIDSNMRGMTSEINKKTYVNPKNSYITSNSQNNEPSSGGSTQPALKDANNIDFLAPLSAFNKLKSFHTSTIDTKGISGNENDGTHSNSGKGNYNANANNNNNDYDNSVEQDNDYNDNVYNNNGQSKVAKASKRTSDDYIEQEKRNTANNLFDEINDYKEDKQQSFDTIDEDNDSELAMDMLYGIQNTQKRFVRGAIKGTTYQSLCPTKRTSIPLETVGFEYRPNHYIEVACVHNYDPTINYDVTKNKICSEAGFSCIQLNRTIHLIRRNKASLVDCWESEMRIVPSGCECMWPKHNYGDIIAYHDSQKRFKKFHSNTINLKAKRQDKLQETEQLKPIGNGEQQWKQWGDYEFN